MITIQFFFLFDCTLFLKIFQDQIKNLICDIFPVIFEWCVKVFIGPISVYIIFKYFLPIFQYRNYSSQALYAPFNKPLLFFAFSRMNLSFASPSNFESFFVELVFRHFPGIGS